MPTYFNDLSNVLTPQDSFVPQLLSATGNGSAVTMAGGANLINMLYSVGAVNTLTSLVLQVQAFDGSAWVNVSGAAVTITAADTTGVLSFQAPQPTSVTANPYTQYRTTGTITGTSAYVHTTFLELAKMPNPGGGFQNAPPTIN